MTDVTNRSADAQSPHTAPELEGHPLADAPPDVHPIEKQVRDAHALLKAKLAAFDARGTGHGPTVDDCRTVFAALDAILEAKS